MGMNHWIERLRIEHLYALLVMKFLIMLGVILYSPIDLTPDEAQYWTWSRDLDFGYYSKPPGIAWEIWLGCQLFGQTELGVRFGALLIGTLLPLALRKFALAVGLYGPYAILASVALTLTPMGFMATILATTDPGLFLFWILAAGEIGRALHRERPLSMFKFTMWIILGAQFRWHSYLLWLPALYYFPRRATLWGLIISLIGLAPTLYWNFYHDFATFRHVGYTLIGGSSLSPAAPNPIDFVGAQAGLLSPLIFLLLLYAFWVMFRTGSEVKPAIRFCGFWTLLILLIGVGLSFFQKMQGNWIVYAYPTGFILIAWMVERRAKKLASVVLPAFIFSLLSVAFVLLPPIFQRDQIGPHVSYKLSILKPALGNETIGPILEKIGYNSETEFLCSASYGTSSLLSFYGPNQKRAYFLNIDEQRKNQFSYWPSMVDEQTGKNGYFFSIERKNHLFPRTGMENVWSEGASAETGGEAGEGELAVDLNRFNEVVKAYQEKLAPYFEKVEFIGQEPMFTANGVVEKIGLIFKCDNFQGKLPPDTHRY
jgi:4-amino-4-deoxy-L-arabinose transferase-like glycosyltransferase